jgi:hypothetical protein
MLMTGSDRSFRTLMAQATDWARERAWNARAGSDYEEEEPLRAALFSSDQMVAHGKLLAASRSAIAPTACWGASRPTSACSKTSRASCARPWPRTGR